MSLLEGLNPAQREAVTTPSGPLLILAGPGSGKTRVITHRVAYLIQELGVSPYRIMAVTFTNKAANEMKARLETLAGRDGEGLTVGTFHATCSRILRREAPSIGLDPHFVIYDEDDQVNLVKRVLKELELDEKRFAPRGILNEISTAKSILRGPHQYSEFVENYRHEVVSRVYRRYQDLLAENGALDFDDLLMSTVELFRTCPDVLERYQERYVHLLVDEFQDTNIAQYALVKQLAGKHKNVCVVGDPDQSIYSWRAADIRNILNFEQDYPDLKMVLLEQNYRSTGTILKAASGVISANNLRKPKKLWTENPSGAPITVFEAYSEEEEASYVAREIERLTDHNGSRLRDFAVMYRTNAQSRALEDKFIRYGLRYKLVGGVRFYERREVKDVLAYLRLLQNPADGVALERVVNLPPRGIGDRTMAELGRVAQQRQVSVLDAIRLSVSDSDDGSARPVLAPRVRKALSNFLTIVDTLMREKEELGILPLLDSVVERTGYRAFLLDGSEQGAQRWENVQELRTVAKEFEHLSPETALDRFLEEAALMSDVDGLDEAEDAVTLITLHAAKGLEFPGVFIVGMEDGICPHSRSFDDSAGMEEERRLCYVGITRAKERLWLVYATRRTLYGSLNYNEPSRFLRDIPVGLAEGSGALATGIAAPRTSTPRGGAWRSPSPERSRNGRPAPRAVPEPAPAAAVEATEAQFRAGDRVYHPAFGNGVVVSSKLQRGDEEVTVAFEQRGVKKLSLSFAPLQRA
ncbi:MAG TPA: UvrD-helicase domain-containing protein [Chloroflexota bacterium]